MTNSKIVMVGLGSILVVGLGWYIFIQRPEQLAMEKAKEQAMMPTITVSAMVKEEEVMVKPTETVMMDKAKESRYTVFASAMELKKVTAEKKVLYFYANWCPTCIPANAEFESRYKEIPENVVVVRVNYNDTDTNSEEKALATRYGITYQHTFVQVDAKGDVVKKWNGGGLDELIMNIK